ncbi:MAG TPA: chemotaxis protein CheB [Solirubrobacteraceae bacterium]|jgi:two-component system chemotaxis response regulator CheB|nr:chemotaxis protein CheB [Solirubrobacteraceae bacterium]
MSAYDIVAIGASWGGLHAVGTVLAGLDPSFGAAVVVAQHRDGHDDQGLLPELLGRRTPLPVAEGEDKGALAPGRVVIAPAGYHLLVEERSVELSCEDPVQFSRPSIDVLFVSVAEEFGPRAVGVVLTGANADGARGLAEIGRRGGHTVVQDPATAERAEMPRAALEAVAPDAVLALDEIAPYLVRLCAEAA